MNEASEDVMSETLLREDLKKLQSLIDALPADDVQRARLAALLADMQSHVDEHGSKPLSQSLRQQLESAITRFESTHPTATAIINNVLVTLGNIGV